MLYFSHREVFASWHNWALTQPENLCPQPPISSQVEMHFKAFLKRRCISKHQWAGPKGRPAIGHWWASSCLCLLFLQIHLARCFGAPLLPPWTLNLWVTHRLSPLCLFCHHEMFESLLTPLSWNWAFQITHNTLRKELVSSWLAPH